MAAPVWQSKGTDLTNASANSAVVALPSSIVAGDVIVIALYKENLEAVTKPSVDWTEITGGGSPPQTDGPQEVRSYWYRAVGGESGTVTFSWTTAVSRAASAHRVTGCVASGSPVGEVNAAFNNTSGSTSPSVALVGTGGDELLVWFGSDFQGGNAWGAASPSFTERTDIDVLAVDTRANVGGFGTGSVTATGNVSGKMTATLFSLVASGAAAPVPRYANPGRTWKRRFKHRQQILTGSAAATGPQSYIQPLNATVGFTSSESVLVRKSLAATAGFTGSLTRRTARTVNATVGFTGSLASLAVHLFTQALNATVGFTSSQTRRPGKAIAATVPFTSSDIVRTSKTLAATVAFTGATARRTTRLVSATVGFAGSLTRRTKRTLAATVSFTGSITSAAVHFFTQALNATVGFTGSLTTLAVHHFAQALNATLSFTGALTARRTVLKLLTATVGFTSSQAKRTGKRITAAGSFTSSIARRVATRIVATLPFTTNYDKVGSGSYAPLIDPAAQVHRNTASAAPRTNPATAAPTNQAAGSAGENPAAATARPNDAEATP